MGGIALHVYVGAGGGINIQWIEPLYTRDKLGTSLDSTSTVLAFSIRKVKVKGLDDTKYIAAAIYVTSIVLSVIIVTITHLLTLSLLMMCCFVLGFSLEQV